MKELQSIVIFYTNKKKLSFYFISKGLLGISIFGLVTGIYFWAYTKSHKDEFEEFDDEGKVNPK
jgi:hypothetical protein